MAGILYGVGIGPGDPELLTLKAVRIIDQCPVIAAPQTESGARLALDIVTGAVDVKDKRILPLCFAMSRDKELMKKNHQKAAQDVIGELEKGNNVAMLNLGDVSIYSTFSYIKAYVQAAGYQTVMIPGVPSFCAVAAVLDENLTPKMDTPLHIVPAGFAEMSEALKLPGTKVIMKAGKPLAQIKNVLKKEGLYEKTSLVQNCGLPDEKVAHGLDEADENGGYFTTMVVRQ